MSKDRQSPFAAPAPPETSPIPQLASSLPRPIDYSAQPVRPLAFSQGELSAAAGIDPWWPLTQLSTGDPSQIEYLAAAFRRASGHLCDAADSALRAHQYVRDGYTVNGMSPSDYDGEATRFIRRTQTHAEDAHHIGNVLDSVGIELHGAISRVRAEIADLDATLAAISGQWQTCASSATTAHLPPTQLDGIVNGYVERAVQAVRASGRAATSVVTSYESTLADALRSLSALGYVPPDRLDEGPGDPLTLNVATLGRDPRSNAAAWALLTPAARLYYITRYPKIIGNAAGLPVVDRSRANLIQADRDIAAYERYVATRESDGLPLGTPTRGGQSSFDRYLVALKSRYDQATALKAGMAKDTAETGQDTYLIAYQPDAYSDGHGRAIMALGNPDAAQRTAVLVSGLGTTVSGNAKNPDAQHLAASVRNTDPNHTTSVVRYLGYNAPGFSDVAFHNMARHGGQQLAADVAGLTASHQGARTYLTVIGHSYGSTTTADACTYGLHADNIVLLGSPGTDRAHNAAALGVGHHVYVGSASRDVVTGPVLAHLGHDPAMTDYGAIRFHAESLHRGTTSPSPTTPDTSTRPALPC